jgi:zeaxanthin glucosyltransferase
LLGTIAQACADLNVRLVIAHGGGLSAGTAASFPGKPIVLAYAPQRAILAKAQAVLCHGGFNTVLDALASGTPMVLIPLGLEQPGTAARVARTGAGLVVRGNRRANAISHALERVLNEPSFRANAERLSTTIAASGGVECAADRVQTLTAKSG